MGAPKPCFGFPSRTAAIAAFRAHGMSTQEIAIKIGISVSTVSALEVGSSRPKIDVPGQYYGRCMLLPVDVIDALGPAAAKRNISASHLARMIVCTVIDEGLIDAVLDDACELDGAI